MVPQAPSFTVTGSYRVRHGGYRRPVVQRNSGRLDRALGQGTGEIWYRLARRVVQLIALGLGSIAKGLLFILFAPAKRKEYWTRCDGCGRWQKA